VDLQTRRAPARAAARVGERVMVELNPYGSGPVVARSDEKPEKLRASERRRRRVADSG
jgi:hypothetical protein